MVSSSEKRRLLAAHREPMDARAAIAKSVAALLIIGLLALIGATASVDADAPVAVKSQQVASGR